MSYVMWLVAAGAWIVLFGAVGAVVAALLGMDPLVGLALSVVLGPFGWIAVFVIRGVTRLASESILPNPLARNRPTAEPALQSGDDNVLGGWRL